MNSDKIKARLIQTWQPLQRISKKIIIRVEMATLASSGTTSASANNQTAEVLADPKIIIDRKNLLKLAAKYTLRRRREVDFRAICSLV